VALGMYFSTLRRGYPTSDGRLLTQGKLARLVREYLNDDTVKVNQSTISRTESGEDVPGGNILAALIDILDGDIEDVQWLFRHRAAPAEEGRRRAVARLHLDPALRKEYEEMRRSPEGRARLLEAAQHFMNES
jgi:transcriptional regulator with XRE-family HTH domain